MIGKYMKAELEDGILGGGKNTFSFVRLLNLWPRSAEECGQSGVFASELASPEKLG